MLRRHVITLLAKLGTILASAIYQYVFYGAFSAWVELIREKAPLE
jgi:hypothetical protein